MLERRSLRQRRFALFYVLAYAYILHLLRNPTIKKPVHTSAFRGHHWLQELRLGHPRRMHEAFRMDAITFEYVKYLHQILVVYNDLPGSGLVLLLPNWFATTNSVHGRIRASGHLSLYCGG
jgi:hypothetical protein